MKKTLYIFATLLIVITSIAAVFLLAQSDNEDETDNCKWIAQNQITDVESWNRVNALYWNECTGEIYHIVEPAWGYSNGTTDIDIVVTKIDLD